MCFVSYYRRDHAKAVEILVKDLKVFSTFNEDLFKEITMLLTLNNFRYEVYFAGLRLIILDVVIYYII